MTTRLRALDVLVPLALLVLGAAELATLGTTGWLPSVGLEAVAAAALVFRRLRPAIAVPVSALALMAIPLTGTQMDEAATPIFFYVLGVYSLGRYLAGRAAVITLVLTLGLVFADFGFDPDDNDWTDLVFILSLAIPPFVFGRISRRLAEQSVLLTQQSQQLREQAVRAERDRIARELHDVIAHSVSAMVVQTAAAQDLVRSSPDRALAILESVAETGRRTLAETGRLLHLVHDEADDTARLDVGTEAGALRIRCTNRVGPGSGSGSGLGLAGMSERVALLDGTLDQGRTGDRFEIEAVIPLPAAVRP
jgi:signal transduction histidine kinase